MQCHANAHSRDPSARISASDGARGSRQAAEGFRRFYGLARDVRQIPLPMCRMIRQDLLGHSRDDIPMWAWLLKLLPKVSPLAEAQKRHYETDIMLLNSEHQKAIEKLERENRNLRLEVQRLKEELSKRPKPVYRSELSDVE